MSNFRQDERKVKVAEVLGQAGAEKFGADCAARAAAEAEKLLTMVASESYDVFSAVSWSIHAVLCGCLADLKHPATCRVSAHHLPACF